MKAIKDFKKVLFNGYKKSEVDTFINKLASILKKQQKLIAKRENELSEAERYILKLKKRSEISEQINKESEKKYEENILRLQSENSMLKLQNENMKFVYEYTSKNVGDIIIAAENIADEIIESASNTVADISAVSVAPEKSYSENNEILATSNNVVSFESYKKASDLSDMESLERKLENLQKNINNSIDSIIKEISDFDMQSENKNVAN